MKNLSYLENCTSVHFIGVGGISMSGLAKYCLSLKKRVSGSDATESDLTEELKNLGATIYIGHSSQNLKDVDLVVYSSAISQLNPEYYTAKLKKIKLIKRSVLLGEILRSFSESIVISGSHGKTTATSMTARIFHDATLSPTAFIGGWDFLLTNYLEGLGKFAIAEGCEYKKNMLDLNPKVAVVLNLDNDHMDSYGSLENMVCAFQEFVKNKISFINIDDPLCEKLITPTSMTFSIRKRADFEARGLRKWKNGYAFSLYSHGVKRGRVRLPIVGRHNVYNALVAFAIADWYGVDFNLIKDSLENFSSVKRRYEYMGKIKRMEVYADYAHHPKEISALLKTVNENDNDTIVVFQPHTYSRTKLLMKDFIECFKKVQNLIIYKTYPAREEFDKDGCAKTLYEKIKSKSCEKVAYAQTPSELQDKIIKFSVKKKRVLFVGAGDVYDVCKDLIQKEKGKIKNKLFFQ